MKKPILYALFAAVFYAINTPLSKILLVNVAPILLMLGIVRGNAANASLLGNFEIVATTLIALNVFHETVSNRLWIALMIMLAGTGFVVMDTLVKGRVGTHSA